MSETELQPAAAPFCCFIEGSQGFDAGGLQADIAIGRFAASPDGSHRLVRLGPDQWLYLTAANAAQPNLPKGAAIFEQSEMRAWFTLSGGLAEAALSSLGPRDLRLPAFPEGAGGRARLGPMTVILLRTGPAAFLIGAPVSFAHYAGDMLTAALKTAQADV